MHFTKRQALFASLPVLVVSLMWLTRSQLSEKPAKSPASAWQEAANSSRSDPLKTTFAETVQHHQLKALEQDDEFFSHPSQIDPTLGDRLSRNFSAPPGKVISPRVDPMVNQVHSEAWIDPEDKANRLRIRIVDTDFKYPKLRLKETVTWNPETKSYDATLISASVADHLLVKPTDQRTIEEVIDEVKRLGYGVRQTTDDLLLLKIPDSSDIIAQQEAIEKLEALEQFIDYAEPDHLLFPCVSPNDPLYLNGSQWSLHNTADNSESISDSDIDAPEGWGVRTSASNITVAVIDTGVRYTHEDLVNRMWDDGLGNPGWDAYDDDTDPMDVDGHGTHCAGIIGAQGNNGVGIAGVAWDVDIMAVRFIGPFGGTTSDAIRSINFARENGADIISASWGGSGYSRGLLAAIIACYQADIPVVVAAGNERWDVDSKPQYPASYATPCIVSVAATGRTDELTTFSNYGYTNIDIAAPGENILSCGIASDSDYRHLSGTSAATPHVAGALALAKAHHGPEAVDRLVSRLVNSVDVLESLEGRVAYEGRLNLNQLLLTTLNGYHLDFFNTPYVFKYCSGYWCRSNGDLTREPDEDSYSPDTGERSAWFQWTAPGNGLLRFSGSGYGVGDISVVAFEGKVRNTLIRLKDNFAARPTAPREYSTLYIYVEKDKTYSFSIDSRTATNQIVAAKFNFTPGNDMLSEAYTIPAGTSFEVEGNNCSATVEPFEYSLPGHPFQPYGSVWWKWTPSTTGNYIISTYGSNFDTVLGVYEATPAMTVVGTNDSRSLTDDTSRLEASLTGGQEYYIMVASYGRHTTGEISLAGFPKEDIRFLQQPQSQLVRYGDSFELSVVADASSEATYEWFGPNGALSSVGSRSSILIPSAGPNDMGDYYVIVRDGEASGTSNTATITELALPPRFLFSPQDISTLDGSPVQMFGKADGLQPITYTWFKEGVEIGTGNLYTIASGSPSDSGIYYVEASNSVGTTRSHPFQVLVSTDTFGPQIYRSPGIPSASKITYVNGRHMGFGNDGRLIISSNGINWENPPIPQLLDIHDIAYDATLGLYVIVGEDRGGSTLAASAVSLDGRNWTKNPAPLPDWSVLDKVVSGNGIFVAYSTWIANKVYTTTNGVDWTPREYTTTGSETWKQLQQIVYYNGEFIGGGRGTIFRSSDGINWTSNATPNDGRILLWDGKLATFTGSPVSFSTSTDGINWTAPVPCVNPPSNLTRITSNGTRFYHAISSTIASSPDGINWHQVEYEIKPTNPYSTTANFDSVSGPEGNLVALGGGGVVQGPTYTELKSPNPEDTYSLPLNTKIFGNTIYQLEDRGYTFKYSNDLRTWRSHTLSIEFEGDSLTQAAGKFWGLKMNITGDQSTLLSGQSPALLDVHSTGTHNTAIYQIRSWNDELYAVSFDQVFKLDSNSNWQVVYTMPKIYNALERIRGLKTIDRGMMIWSDYGAVYTSLNGTTWVRAQSDTPSFIVADNQHPTTKPRYAGPSFCEFDGKAYIYTSASNKLYVATTGFNFTEQLNLNPFSRMTAVPEGLLGIEDTTGWYSPDGTTWQQFPIHYLTEAFHHFNGTLLAIGNNGLYQAGNFPSAPPTNSLTNLVEYQTVISGNLFDLEYSAIDPEGLFDRVEFYLNGELISQSTDAEGLASLNITGGGQRILEMRSYDQDGNVTRDYWTLSILGSAPDKVLSVQTPSTYTYYSVWGDRLQAGIGQQLFTRIDDNWVGRFMPFNISDAAFVFNPDAVFAVGPDIGSNQNVLMSDDGIRWNGLNYRVDSLKYEDGRHLGKLIRHRTGGQTSNLGVSPDGISWNKSSVGNLGSAAGNGVVVGVTGAGFGNSTIKTSSDGGATWTASALLEMYNIQFDAGYFMGTGYTTYYRSMDGINWSNLAPTFEAGETIQNLDIAGGWYYLLTRNGNTYYLWISQDNGATWTKFTNPPPKAKQVSYGNGMWFCIAQDGLYTSGDGLNWQICITLAQISDGSLPMSLFRGAKFLAHEGGVSTLMANKLYTTTDGFNWQLESTPAPAGAPPLITEPMIIDANTKVAKVYSKVFISNDGANWSECPLDPGTGKAIRHIAKHDNKILVYSGANNQATDLWESADGYNFTQTTLNGSYFFNTVKFDGTRLFAKGNIIGGAFNQFMSSTDGANWTQLTTPGYYNSTIELLNGTLIIMDSFNSQVHHSADGSSWQSTNINLENLTYGNGVFLGSKTSTMWRGASIASLATITSDTSPYQAKLAHADGNFYLKTSSGIWKSTDGEVWQQLYTAINGNLEAIGDTIYINDNTSLRPLIAADLQVTAVTGTPGNLAVGANLNATISMKNIGDIPIPAGTTLEIQGALSRDGLFGNEDDEYAGTFETVLASEMAVGATTDIPVSYRIPGLRAGGQFRLVLMVKPDCPELTRTNNTDMTDDTIVTVDEFVLNITRNGQGNVDPNLSALRYANGTLVTLSATPTKGSGFGGWGGSTVSPLSNITVMMNQDQNLTANFVANVALNLVIRGAGTVEGWSEPGSYASGDTASLTAQPDSGWEFAGWTGASTSTNPALSLTVNDNTNLTAVFRQTLGGWKGMHFSPAELVDSAISGDLVDTDMDGVPNWREYLHGSDPRSANSMGLEQSGLSGGFLQIVYTRNQGAEAPYALICEGSRDMSGWNAPNFEERVLSTQNGVETVEARMPATGAGNERGFVRIRYEQP